MYPEIIDNVVPEFPARSLYSASSGYFGCILIPIVTGIGNQYQTMRRVEKTVFICYRRTNIPWALAIFQALTHQGYDVFFDFKSIASGDFERVIVENINSRAHFLVLLTPSALENCNRSDDWLRREIETALDTQRNIVPLMLDGFDFGSPGIASQLTGKLAALKQYNALHIPANYFDEAMNRLHSTFLNVPLDTVLHPVSSLARLLAKEQQSAANNAEAVQQKELTAQEWFERGGNTTDIDERLRCYDQAIRLRPDFAKAFYNRGLVRQNKRDREGAYLDFTEAISLDPDYAAAYFARGEMYFFRFKVKNNVEDSSRDFAAAIRLDPDNAKIYKNRGLFRSLFDDKEGALLDYNEAIRLDPNDADTYHSRGRKREENDLRGALQDYTQAISLNPNFAHAYSSRGSARGQNGDFDAGLRDHNEAIRLDPDKGDYYAQRGNTREIKGDLEGALRDYTEAIRLDSNGHLHYMRRGRALEKKGDRESARRDYLKAAQLDSSSAEFLKKMGKLG